MGTDTKNTRPSRRRVRRAAAGAVVVGILGVSALQMSDSTAADEEPAPADVVEASAHPVPRAASPDTGDSTGAACRQLQGEIDELIGEQLAALADEHGVSDSMRQYLCSHLVKQQGWETPFGG